MKIALVGNQNSGKTTLFNLLTGSNQKVGNWPGVTIDKKIGIIRGTDFEIIDLPGIYSFSPYTKEEAISREYVFNEKPDLIINIVDATSLERSLYLTTQLMELDSKLIVALNMSDMVEKKGIAIDIKKLQTELGIEIIPISALKQTGVEDLIRKIQSAHLSVEPRKIFSIDIENVISQAEANWEGIHRRFAAVKILEKDPLFSDNNSIELNQSIRNLETDYDMDMEEIIASLRYQWIETVKAKSVTEAELPKKSITDMLDRIFLNKYLGIPIFAIIMFLVYFLSVGIVGGATVTMIENAVGSFQEYSNRILSNLGASKWAISLVCDGIISGIGSILNFIPQLVILFLCIVLLETTGYMSRIAFLLDKLFRKFGLSGKALIPFIVGSGCSVPGIMTSRTIEDSKEREMLITLTPFIPCSAKLPIISLFSGFFFPKSAGLVTFSLYFLAIFIILISALVMKKIFRSKSGSSFISELPEYKLPNFQYVAKDVFNKSWGFIRRAGTVIFVCSVAVWFLLSFSWEFEYGPNIEDSMLASIGRLLSWAFYPMLGELSWGTSVSALQGLVAKEQVISSMAIISGLSEETSGGLIFASEGIFGFFNPASAYAFMAFTLFSAPCISSIGAMRKEFNSFTKTFKAVSFQTVLALLLSYAIYYIGTVIGGIQ